MEIEQIILIRCKTEIIRVKIIDIKKFSNFNSLLSFDENSLNDTLPFVNSLEEGIKLYNGFYKEADILKYGVVSLKLKILE